MSQTTKLNWRVDEFCAAFGIGRTKFYALVNAGEIRTMKLGRMTLIADDEVRAFQDRLVNGGGNA